MRDKYPDGLGGWLVLVGIGIVLTPLRILNNVLEAYLPVFTDGTWVSMTTPGSPAYYPLLATTIVGEVTFDLGMAVAFGYLIYLFFAKDYRFPRFFIGVFLLPLIFIPADAWIVTSFVMPDKPMFDRETTFEFARVLITVMIWVPYMLLSKRVKATFVKGAPIRAEIFPEGCFVEGESWECPKCGGANPADDFKCRLCGFVLE